MDAERHLLHGGCEDVGYLYRLDPATKAVTRLAPSERWIGSGFSLSADAQTVAFTASDASTFPEIYVASVKTMAPKRLTTTGDQVASWPSAPIEVISWKSQDGATIEGILHKPVGFKPEPGTRYCGHPRRPDRYLSRHALQQHRNLSIDLWVNKGALVLEPNYRGSAGYGEKFRSLDYRNLGVGDAWDVLSGIDYLVRKVGRRGPRRHDRLEPGGYIPAFLTTRQRKVKAVPDDAGSGTG